MKAFAEGQAKTKYAPQYGNNNHANNALQHSGDHILFVYHTPIKKGEAGGHNQNQRG